MACKYSAQHRGLNKKLGISCARQPRHEVLQSRAAFSPAKSLHVLPHTCNPSTWEAEGSGVQGHSQIQGGLPEALSGWGKVGEEEWREGRGGEVPEGPWMQGAFLSEHCLTVPGIAYQQFRTVLLTSSSLEPSSEEAGTGSEVQGFCFVSHSGSQMFGCQDFLQHSLEVSDKLDFVCGGKGSIQSTFFFKTLLLLILEVLDRLMMNRPTAAELDRRARGAGEHQAGGCCSRVLVSGHGIGVQTK